LEIQTKVSEFEKQASEAMIKHKDFMSDMALSEACERNRVSGRTLRKFKKEIST
jgi:hypothetical protein